MDHTYIVEQDIAGRYLNHSLPPDERARFEDHFVDCPQCLDVLERLEEWQRSLRAIAADATARTAGAESGPRPRWHATVAGAAGIAAAIAIAVGAADLFRTRRELARTMQADADLTRQYADAEARAKGLSDRVQELERNRNAGSVPADASVPSTTPVFVLARVRGRDAVPSNRIVLVGDPQWIVLSMELEEPAAAKGYRATIRSADGREVWADENVTAANPEAIAIGLRTMLLPDGDYRLTLERRHTAGGWLPGGQFTFRVVRNQPVR